MRHPALQNLDRHLRAVPDDEPTAAQAEPDPTTEEYQAKVRELRRQRDDDGGQTS